MRGAAGLRPADRRKRPRDKTATVSDGRRRAATGVGDDGGGDGCDDDGCINGSDDGGDDGGDHNSKDNRDDGGHD